MPLNRTSAYEPYGGALYAKSLDQSNQGKSIRNAIATWGTSHEQRECSIQFAVCKQAYAPFKKLKSGLYRRAYGCRLHEAERCRRIKLYGLRTEWHRYDQWSPPAGARLVATHPILLEDNKTIRTIHDEPVTTDDVLAAQIMLLTADEQAELVRLGVFDREVPADPVPARPASCVMPALGRSQKGNAATARRPPASKPKTKPTLQRQRWAKPKLPVLPSEPNVVMQDGALMVPCEICQVPIPFDNVLMHLQMEHGQRVGLPLKKRRFEGSDVPMQCTFCGDIVSAAKYDAHFARHLDVGAGRSKRKRPKQRGEPAA